ncbi:MAG: hypothetical protein Kow0063_18800 [Anaerolineae bacterium]
MEPVSMIVAALAAGAIAATKDVAAQAVKDGYQGLKSLVVGRFGAKADVAGALEGVEKNPGSEARKAVLKEELENAQAGQDAEVVRQARVLLDLLEAHGLGASYHASVHGPGAIAQGPGAVAAGERGVAIGGDVKGGTIVTGDRNVVGGGGVQTGEDEG